MISTLFLALTVSAQAAVDCKAHPIYCHIKRLRPGMPQAKAMRLSNRIYKAARAYRVNPQYSVAIIMGESGFRTTVAKVVHTNGAVDYGFVQITRHTARAYDLDPERVMFDEKYQIWGHMLILADKMRICKGLDVPKPERWSCYHSFTPQKRQRYYERVRKYL